ncbi:hypothetical protein LDENG_00287100 [Lucifuga dentata]|nr:hypothetical protein LDENG_00287100 [Lucifuga dentata]
MRERTLLQTSWSGDTRAHDAHFITRPAHGSRFKKKSTSSFPLHLPRFLLLSLQLFASSPFLPPLLSPF